MCKGCPLHGQSTIWSAFPCSWFLVAWYDNGFVNCRPYVEQAPESMMPHFDDIRAHFPVSVHTVYAPNEGGHTIFNTSEVAKRFTVGANLELSPANLLELYIFNSSSANVSMPSGNLVFCLNLIGSLLFRASVFPCHGHAQSPWHALTL
jgi:hypothetical protein